MATFEMAWTIKTMEDALLGMLQADPTLQNVCRTIESYAGQLEQDMAHIPQLYPALYLTFLRAEYEPGTNEEYRAHVSYAVLIATQTLLGNMATRRGEGGEVGAYDLLRLVKIALAREEIPDLGFAYLVREEVVVASKALSIYQAEYQIRDVLINYGE